MVATKGILSGGLQGAQAAERSLQHDELLGFTRACRTLGEVNRDHDGPAHLGLTVQVHLDVGSYDATTNHRTGRTDEPARSFPTLPVTSGAMSLQGFSALVTGAASGMGEAAARRLAAEGAHVVIVDRDAAKGEAVAKELGGTAAEADVVDEASMRAAFDAAKEVAPLRACIHCAGVGWVERTINRDGSPHMLDTFRKILDINLIGTFNAVRFAASAMNGNEADDNGQRGVIVNTASVAAFDGQIGQLAYSASKGGVVSMTLTAARDLSAAGIRVCTIAPGLVDTPLLGMLPDDARAELGRSVLFPKRLGTADEFASLAMEIVRNPYLNGEVIRLDAGIRMPPK
jgi:NAD(P)-dependent dehydrogenase (short-subunit alcohol dehydrogenase family)